MNSPALCTNALLAPALSPRLQRAVRLLQMSSLDFSQWVRRALEVNPFLETIDSDDAPQDDPLQADTLEAAWGSEPRTTRRVEGGEGTVFDTLAAPTTLVGHLMTQLNVLSLPDRDRVLALAVTHCLDDDGYLRIPLADVGVAAALVPAVDSSELTIALRRVQALDPTGVAARDLAECLHLQLGKVPASVRGVDLALAMQIVQHHLPALANGDLAAMARRLGVAREAVQTACEAIRRLDPRPGWRHGTHAIEYVTPDVVVRRQRGRWTTHLNPAVIPRVCVNRLYAEWFNRYREPGQAELGGHLQEAKWTVRNVEQRFATILSVARAIVQRQQQFLALGPMAMRPMALREIADAVGVHESTVSRVTNNKFIATPCGVFELKYFFSRALGTASGGECSATAIRGLLQELIASESPGTPLSDVALAQLLARQGLRVARRTVTKYRQQLKIVPAERRRRGIR
jgi:RNA polymerase sigma-54 factor